MPNKKYIKKSKKRQLKPRQKKEKPANLEALFKKFLDDRSKSFINTTALMPNIGGQISSNIVPIQSQLTEIKKEVEKQKVEKKEDNYDIPDKNEINEKLLNNLTMKKIRAIYDAYDIEYSTRDNKNSLIARWLSSNVMSPEPKNKQQKSEEPINKIVVEKLQDEEQKQNIIKKAIDEIKQTEPQQTEPQQTEPQQTEPQQTEPQQTEAIQKRKIKKTVNATFRTPKK